MNKTKSKNRAQVQNIIQDLKQQVHLYETNVRTKNKNNLVNWRHSETAGIDVHAELE